MLRCVIIFAVCFSFVGLSVAQTPWDKSGDPKAHPVTEGSGAGNAWPAGGITDDEDDLNGRSSEGSGRRRFDEEPGPEAPEGSGDGPPKISRNDNDWLIPWEPASKSDSATQKPETKTKKKLPIDEDDDVGDIGSTNKVGNEVPDADPAGKNALDDGHIFGPGAANDRPASFFAQPGILAAVIGGVVVGLLCTVLLLMYIVYRMRKMDEGSYMLEEPRKTPATKSSQEFFA